MKKLIFPFVLLLFVFSSCRKNDKEQCVDSRLIDENMACTEEYDPVCGCNGVTYDNACVAKFQNGVKFYTQGACNCDYKHSGTVVNLTGTDGCGLVIRKNDSSYLEISSLPGDFILQEGMNVRFDYTVNDSSISFCMIGDIVNITCIKEDGCRLLNERSVLDTAHPYKDGIYINKASIQGDCLYITYAYGGGCHNDHKVQLTELLSSCSTPPSPPPYLLLEHNGNGDLCQAIITKSASFDLTSLRVSWQDSVQFSLNADAPHYNKTFMYRY